MHVRYLVIFQCIPMTSCFVTSSRAKSAVSILSLARVAAVSFANADKVAIPSLPFQCNGSTTGAQSLLGSKSGNGAVLYSLQCPSDAATTVAVRMVRDAAAAGFGMRH